MASDGSAKYEEKGQKVCSWIALVCLQGLCGAALVAGVRIVPSMMGLHLITETVKTLQITLALALPVFLATYASIVMLSSKPSSVLQALGNGLLSLPVGAGLAVLVAFAFGAPISLQYAVRTWYWACLMSVLVVVPAAMVLGASWSDWQRLFAFTRPKDGVELAVCVPAHGVAIGAWLGAWPMPLDWERPWQEWPICCTYGAIGGYLLGLTVSVVLSYISSRQSHSKKD